MNINFKEIRTPVMLIGLMLATRFHHFGGTFSLPDASLAAFFFAGLWVKGWKFFALLLLEAGLIDYVAISQFSVSDYCISPAYAFLIPTYASLWGAGYYCSRYKKVELSTLVPQFSILFIATSVAFALSNGSFYLLSGKFSDLAWAEYTTRVAQYYPSYLGYTLLYVAIIFSVVKVVNALSSTSLNPAINQGE